jgi:hypothetical protein
MALSVFPVRGETPMRLASDRSEDRTRLARESVTFVPSLRMLLNELVNDEVTDEPQVSLPEWLLAEFAEPGVMGRTTEDDTLRLYELGGARSSVPRLANLGATRPGARPRPSAPMNLETLLDISDSDALGDLALSTRSSPAVALLMVLTSSPKRSPAVLVPST